MKNSNLKQEPNFEPPLPDNDGLKTCPVIFLIDVSGSMRGNENDSDRPIDKLNKSLKTCLLDLKNDQTINRRTAICIFAFAREVTMIQDFTLCVDFNQNIIDNIESQILSINEKKGVTSKFFDAICQGIEELQSYINIVEQNQDHTISSEPTLIFMTDGKPTTADGKEIADETILNAKCDEIRDKLTGMIAKNRENQILPQIYAFSLNQDIGKSQDTSRKILQRLAGETKYFLLEGYNFDKLFAAITHSIALVSKGFSEEAANNLSQTLR